MAEVFGVDVRPEEIPTVTRRVAIQCAVNSGKVERIYLAANWYVCDCEILPCGIPSSRLAAIVYPLAPEACA